MKIPLSRFLIRENGDTERIIPQYTHRRIWKVRL